MNHHLVTVLQQELIQLEVELKNDPRYRKATRIRELLADYQAHPRGLAAQSSAVPVSPPPPAAPPPMREPGPRLSKKALIKNEIEQLLLYEGPTHRKKILEILQSKGLMGHEKDPMASLAAYLSAFSDNFVNNGTGTWSVRERKPTPEQAA